VILTILPSAGKVTFDALDAAGARNAPQLCVKVPFHHPMEPMLNLRFVRSVQNHPAGHQYAAR
jgi:hypothetical protein